MTGKKEEWESENQNRVGDPNNSGIFNSFSDNSIFFTDILTFSDLKEWIFTELKICKNPFLRS